MATYVTKKCPHCGYIYQLPHGGEQRKYGCPYQTCTRCYKSYWDTYIKEPALYGYENSYETRQSIKRAIVIILYTPFASFMLGIGIYLLLMGEMIGLFCLAVGGYIVWEIGSHIKQKIDDNRHWGDIIKNRQIDYDKSIARLKDTNYLTALSKYDKLAKKLLEERINGAVEHYAKRPQ